jgi:flagellar export protein FliJ
MAFRFPLAAVLRVRESLERKEQLILEQCYNRLHELQAHLARLDEQKQSWRRRYEEQLIESTIGIHVHVLIEERQSAERQREELLRLLADAQEKLKQQMARYRAVRQQREIVSELRSQGLEKYRRLELLQEQKSRDDLFLLRRLRRK